jgi:hypothetical protein
MLSPMSDIGICPPRRDGIRRASKAFANTLPSANPGDGSDDFPQATWGNLIQPSGAGHCAMES